MTVLVREVRRHEARRLEHLAVLAHHSFAFAGAATAWTTGARRAISFVARVAATALIPERHMELVQHLYGA
jgi:hypothetical protein